MIKDCFIAPNYALRVGQIGPEHAVRVSCLCGAGPWFLHSFWFRRRYSEHEFVVGVINHKKCPKCGTTGTMAFSTVEAFYELNGPI